MAFAPSAPKSRRNTAIVTTIFYLVTIPLLILVVIGNTHKNHILSEIYFFKLDVSHIIPISADNSHLLNSVARSLGLHDFYQVGLWNFCEGYNNEGITYCSEPVQWYWFDPVKILVGELLSGATIALPSQALTVLSILRIGGRVMYGFFMIGTVFNFVLLFLSPLAMRTRWWSLPLSVFSLVSAILIAVAAVIATVMSVAFKVALTAQDQLNISADIGIRMFCFMWISAILTVLAFFLHAGMACCCKPRRHQASSSETPKSSDEEKRPKIPLPSFARRRRTAAARAD